MKTYNIYYHKMQPIQLKEDATVADLLDHFVNELGVTKPLIVRWEGITRGADEQLPVDRLIYVIEKNEGEGATGRQG